MSDPVFEISERLEEAVEAELARANARSVLVALMAIIAALVATMPRKEADEFLKLVRTDFSEIVNAARSKL